MSRAKTACLVASPLRPWWAQRVAMRCTAQTRVVVTGRQLGKTTFAAHEVLATALARPRSLSLVVAPVGVFLQKAIDVLRTLAKDLPGVTWLEQRKRFELRNGSLIECLSGESAGGEAPRGRTVDGVLWFDEAGYLPEATRRAALGTTLAGNGRVLITTTPAGRNWVWREFNRQDGTTVGLRFRASDSPYVNKERLASTRDLYAPEQAAQELDAEFVDDLTIAFPDVSRLFVPSFPDRSQESVRSLRWALGVDLAQRQDWLVITAMNRWGEAVVLERVQQLDWTDAKQLIAEAAAEHQALVVLDDGPGSSAGAVLEADLKHEKKLRVRVVRTGVPGKKAELVDKARLAVRWGQIKVLDNHLAARLRHELQQFQAIRRVVSGKELVVYQGPQLQGEHDDCVLSLCLANWGRLILDEEGPLEEDYDPQEIVEFGQANLRAHAESRQAAPVELPAGFPALPSWMRRSSLFPFFPNP